MKLLFVCTGNTCRSPMAQILSQDRFPSHTCSSAGLFAVEGQRISPLARTVLENDYHLSAGDHRAVPLTKEALEEADLVIAMTWGHKALLEARFGLSPKYIAMPEDIPDPYGEDEETYRRCGEAILAGLSALAEEGVL